MFLVTFGLQPSSSVVVKTRIILLLAALAWSPPLPAQTPGSLDTTFQAQRATNFTSWYYRPLAAQPDGKIDGKIILAQFWKVNGSPTRQLVRLNTDGSRDETYVSELRHDIHLRDGVDDFQVQAMVLQPDEKLVVSTIAYSDEGTPVRSIIRLHGDGAPYIVPASIRADSHQSIGFQMTAATNRTVVVESSPNLKSGPWTVLATFPPAVRRETIQFSDNASANTQQRFYRVVSP